MNSQPPIPIPSTIGANQAFTTNYGPQVKQLGDTYWTDGQTITTPKGQLPRPHRFIRNRKPQSYQFLSPQIRNYVLIATIGLSVLFYISFLIPVLFILYTAITPVAIGAIAYLANQNRRHHAPHFVVENLRLQTTGGVHLIQVVATNPQELEQLNQVAERLTPPQPQRYRH